MDVPATYQPYRGLFSLGANLSEILQVGSQFRKLYSGMLYKVRLWVAIVTLAEFSMSTIFL